MKVNSGNYVELSKRTDITYDHLYQHEALEHGMVGLMTETGEIASAIKKWKYYNQRLDKENIKEELGDLLWYIAIICNDLGFTLDEVMGQNVEKLKKRYPDGYSDLSAKERRDKND